MKISLLAGEQDSFMIKGEEGAERDDRSSRAGLAQPAHFIFRCRVNNQVPRLPLFTPVEPHSQAELKLPRPQTHAAWNLIT